MHNARASERFSVFREHSMSIATIARTRTKKVCPRQACWAVRAVCREMAETEKNLVASHAAKAILWQPNSVPIVRWSWTPIRFTSSEAGSTTKAASQNS